MIESNHLGPLYYTSDLNKKINDISTCYWNNFHGFDVISNTDYMHLDKNTKYIKLLDNGGEIDIIKILNHFTSLSGLVICFDFVLKKPEKQSNYNLTTFVVDGSAQMSNVFNLFPNLKSCYVKTLNPSNNTVKMQFLEKLSVVNGTIEAINELILPKLHSLDLYNIKNRPSNNKINQTPNELRIDSKCQRNINYYQNYTLLQFIENFDTIGLEKISMEDVQHILEMKNLKDFLPAKNMIPKNSIRRLSNNMKLGVYLDDDNLSEYITTFENLTVYKNLNQVVLISPEKLLANYNIFDSTNLKKLYDNRKIEIKNEYMATGKVKKRIVKYNPTSHTLEMDTQVEIYDEIYNFIQTLKTKIKIKKIILKTGVPKFDIKKLNSAIKIENGIECKYVEHKFLFGV